MVRDLGGHRACRFYEIMIQYTSVHQTIMYDDYEIDFYSNDCSLDEDSYYENHTRDLHEDDDYARDGQDYQDLAYRHYA